MGTSLQLSGWGGGGRCIKKSESVNKIGESKKNGREEKGSSFSPTAVWIGKRGDHGKDQQKGEKKVPIKPPEGSVPGG